MTSTEWPRNPFHPSAAVYVYALGLFLRAVILSGATVYRSSSAGVPQSVQQPDVKKQVPLLYPSTGEVWIAWSSKLRSYK